jgi:hypothetical protein
MEHLHNVKNWQWLCWVIAAISIIIKAYFYLKIKHDKSVKEFIMDYFMWATPIGIRNSGAEKNRKEYMKVNNRCVIVLWLSLFAWLVLLFR